jgi:hypothetical protein
MNLTNTMILYQLECRVESEYASTGKGATNEDVG